MCERALIHCRNCVLTVSDNNSSFLLKRDYDQKPAPPLCFNGEVVQDHDAQSHRSVLPCVDRKLVFFGSESRQFTVRHQAPCSCGLVTMLEGPVACDVIRDFKIEQREREGPNRK